MTSPHAAPASGATPVGDRLASGATPPRSGTRDGFLDVVRALAVIRVVVWHAFGAAVLTYLVAAMPAMFFVSGSLFARSARNRGVGRTVVDRLRRMAPSMWAFAAVAWVVMAVAAWRTGTALEVRNAVFWLLPLADPTGSAWEGGWLSAPLWYLRTFVWVLVLSPVILWSVRRRPALALGVGLVLVGVTEVVDRMWLTRPSGTEQLVWQVGDVVLFGWFFAVGVVAAAGALDGLRRAHWALVAGVAALAAAGWAITQPVPLGVVNNSHPMHLFVGVVWLALAMLAAPFLRRVAEGALQPVVQFVGQRSLTIYLWNSAAIAVVLWGMERLAIAPNGVGMVTYVAAIAVVVVVATVAFGWVEDLAARRPPRLWPLRVEVSWGRPRWPVLAATATVVALVAASSGVAAVRSDRSTTVAFRPPVPSQAPPTPVLGDPEQLADGAAVAVTYRDGLFATSPAEGGLQGLLDDWAAHHGVAGASLAVLVPTQQTPADGSPAHDPLPTEALTHEPLVVVTGEDEDGRPRHPDDLVDVMSVTKLFTANVVHRVAAFGLLDLDAPMPALSRYPDFPHPQLTPRNLLAHQSGLSNYWDTPVYADAPLTITDPLDAVAAVAQQPLRSEPGSVSEYSSTNYLLLGLILEEVTGVPFTELLQDLVLDPLALSSVVHLPPEPGFPRGATAGILADLADLTVAGAELVREPLGLDDLARADLRTIDQASGIGPGLNGYCPCAETEDARVEWFGVGYTGGHTVLLHLPGPDLVVALDLTGTLWSDHRFEQVMRLMEDLVAFDWDAPVAPVGDTVTA